MRPEMPDPIFVIGCSRSGTTVTFETLRASPALISMPYEVPQLWNGLAGPAANGWASEAAGAEDAVPEHRERAMAWFYARLGRGKILEKTCINVMRVPYLHALFPKARFVYLHRDGRNNVSSLMDGWREHGRFDLEQYLGRLPDPVNIAGGEFKDWCFFLPPRWREYNDASLEDVCAYQWNVANSMALEAGRTLPGVQWIPVRYEDIVERPLDTFESLFEKLGLDFDPQVRHRCATLADHPTSIIAGPPRRNKWRERNREAVERILDKIDPVMRRLGYETYE